MTIALKQDYRTGYEAVRRVLAVSEARGYEPQTSHARFLFSLGSGHWFEPASSNIEQAWRAREGLQSRGSPLVCFTYFSSVPQFLDCASTLERFTAEVDASLATAARVGDEHSAAAYVGYRQLGRALRGETETAGGLDDAQFGLADHLDALAANPTAAANIHTTAAVAAVIFNDPAALSEHATAAMALLPFINATYLTVTTRLMYALAMVERMKGAEPAERAASVTAFTEIRDWIAERAADAPENFGHLVHLLDAERGLSDGDKWGAAVEFDAAARTASELQRPWHQALIAERAGRFNLEFGLEHVGRSLLVQARQHYDDWGAAGKVVELDRQYPSLGPTPQPSKESAAQRRNRSISVPSSTIDVLGILSASHALSSATSFDGVRARLGEVLGAMTGATSVHLLMWDVTAADWRLTLTDDEPNDAAATGVDHGSGTLLVGDAAAAGRVPISVIRYVQRTLEPLLLEDATRDPRFASDPYLAGLDCCSLLAVPIISRGVLQALLLLETRSGRGAFTTERLDSVMLVAGQLAVSIENAGVYASLERTVTTRTQALAIANERLETLNQTDSLTGLANRRRLDSVLDIEWSQALAADLSIGVAMVDIDHFKQYNDHYGHLSGDECLREVAAALSASARATDLTARYGGEEFMIILPGADFLTTQYVAERARLSVAALQQPHASSPVGFVTVSIGIAAVVPAPGTTPEQLVSQADVGLYEAKRSGRNRVCGPDR